MLPIDLRRARPLLVLLAAMTVAALALVGARPAGACACGVAYGTTVGQEQALLTLADGRQQIVLSLDLTPAPADRDSSAGDRRPAVVLPVPATPRVTALSADEGQVFAQLDRATAPRRDQGGNGSDGAAAPAGGSVRVLSRATIGGYDVTRLRATGGDALRRWLDGHGYVTPKRAAPVLQQYVDRGWAFVAIRLAGPVTAEAGQGGGDRALRPLRIDFPSRRLVYPLRLSATSTRPVSATLYVAGPHRVVAKGFDTYHAGWVADLRPPLSEPVAALLRGGTYVTKLAMVRKDPRSITGDVTVRQAVSDRLFRATDDYPFESEAGFATAPLPSAADPTPRFDGPAGALWLVLIPGVALLVGLFGLVLRLRTRRRAGR